MNYILKLILLPFLFLSSMLIAQERSKNLVKSLETTNPEAYKKMKEELKTNYKEVISKKVESKSEPQTKLNNETIVSTAKPIENNKSSDSKNVSEKVKDSVKKTNSASSPTNTAVSSAPQKTSNAALKSEIDARNAAIDAANRKNRMKDKDVEYYNALRIKFEEEAKLKAEKEAKEAEEKAKKEAEDYNNRHLKPADAPQFDKYRNGAKNEEAKKTTAEEDYNKLFK